MIRHYEISHFRAPYKNATVQGYDGLGVYDFVDSSSPPLDGFGEPAPSEKDPRVLINKWYADTFTSNPENIGYMVAKLKTVIGDPQVQDTNRDILQQPIIDTFSTLFEHGGTAAQAKAIVDTTMAWLQSQSNLSKYSSVDATEFLTVLGVMNALVELGRKQAVLRMMRFNAAPPPPVAPTTSPFVVSASAGRRDPGYVVPSLPPAPVPVARPTTAGPVVVATPKCPGVGAKWDPVAKRCVLVGYTPCPPGTVEVTKTIKNADGTEFKVRVSCAGAIKPQEAHLPSQLTPVDMTSGDAAVFAEARRLAEERAAAEAAAEKAAEEGKMPSWVLPAAIGAVGLVVAVAILKK